MKKIGITGGIGSGKSTVCKVFELLKVPVYYADERSKFLLNNSDIVIAQIKKIFGDDIYTNSGIDRKQLATIVFSKPELLQQLNDILHPAVFNDFDNWCKQYQHNAYVLKEAALIYETIIHQKLDKIIVVAAPETIRINRVMQRDNVSSEAVHQRIKYQMSEAEKINRADYVINNDEHHLIIPQILRIHSSLAAE